MEITVTGRDGALTKFRIVGAAKHFDIIPSMSRTIKTGEKAQLRIDNGLHEVAYTVMTASGPAQKIRLFDDLESADQFFQEREAGMMPTNGYELHTAADL